MQQSINNTQFFNSFFNHIITCYLLTQNTSTYSLSGCQCPGLTFGPFLWGGGDTSTTSGDGGGISTTSGDECMDMTSSSLQKQKNNSPQLAQITQLHTAQNSNATHLT